MTKPSPPKLVPWYRKSWGIFLLVILALSFFFLGVLGYFVLQSYNNVRRGLSPDGTIALEQYSNTKDFTQAGGTQAGANRVSRDEVETTDDPTFGPASALVTIVEFGDFECPFCRQSFFDLKEILEKYRDKVRIIYRDYPNTSIHPNAMHAALAAGCAQDQGKFWAFHDLLYINQEQLSDADLELYAQQAGVDVTQYRDCFRSQRHIKEIQEDIDAGTRLGVRGTPTWFFNGRRVEGALPLDIFKRIVDLGVKGKL